MKCPKCGSFEILVYTAGVFEWEPITKRWKPGGDRAVIESGDIADCGNCGWDGDVSELEKSE